MDRRERSAGADGFRLLPGAVLLPAAICALMGVLGLVGLLTPSGGTVSLPTTPTLWLALILFQLPTLVVVDRFLRQHATGWVDGFGLAQIPPGGRGLWILGSVAVCVSGLLLVHLGVHRIWRELGGEPQLQASIQALQQGSFWMKLTITFSAVVMAPLVEEPLFRGILYPAVRQSSWGGRSVAWLGSSVLFGIAHGNVGTLLPLTLFGAYQCWLYDRTRNLGVCILNHAGFNAVFVALTLTQKA